VSLLSIGFLNYLNERTYTRRKAMKTLVIKDVQKNREKCSKADQEKWGDG